ncbi:glycosyltransferase family 39 protein [Rossellomorea aquimaris]|uniref:glycosyltransferase family 39 protein n=1 Tax=Rossellomorea aquimaris TaxID=189382 RepID=UPI001CD45B3A|nr:glycosyltransferase family 39 protein [Rossellomorea aquimaris]MCA1060822.1 glycosyltransferase family 39 protein [Rossellomorea aquimaris]
MGFKIIHFLHRFIYVIFFALLLFLVGLNIYMSRGYSSLSMHMPEYFNIITLIVAVLIAVCLFRFREKVRTFFEIVPPSLAVVGLLGISLALQLIVVKELNVNPSWDFRAVVDSATRFVETGDMGEYYTIYPNNILLTCILVVIGKIISPDLIVFQILNVIVITLSQFLIYRIATKVAGKAVGIASLLMSVLFFPYFFYSPVVYTDTFSLVFLLLPLNLLINKEGEFKEDIFFIIAASILFSFGMLLKGSLIIFTIAFSIVLLLNQKKWRKVYFIIPFIILLVVKSLFSSGLYQFNILDKEKVEERSMPVTHWIVMSQNEDHLGKYSQEDVDWTKSLLEKYPRSKVTELHFQEFKNRIAEKGFAGNIQFNIEKIGHTWTDGTYYSLNKLRRFPEHPEHFEHLMDHKSGHILQGYARVQHLVILLGLLLALRLKEKKSIISFTKLSVIGFFLFFIIWETRSRYLVSLTPLMIMLSCMGYLDNKNDQKGLSENNKISH